MRRDWETRLAEEPEYNSRMKKCAEFSKEATPEVTKEKPILEKPEQEHIKSRTTQSVDFVVSNETSKRSMSSAKPLREFEPMDWVPIDYGEVFDKRRPFPSQKGMERALEVDIPLEKKVEDVYDLEITGEIFQKLFGDDEMDPEHIAEVKRIMGIKPEASPYARLAEVYTIGSEEEKMAPHLSCEINGVQCKALCDIGAQVSVLSSKIYNKVQDHNLDLAPMSMKLIMGDGRTIRPLGIACNMNVKISGTCIHLPVHLAEEAKFGGPVCYRWMYPIERYLRTLKGYVRNKAHPEGSIAEGYILEECMTFCCRFVEDIETKLDRPMHHEGSVVNEPPAGSNILGSIDDSKKCCKLRHLPKSEMLRMRHYIFSNCDEAVSWIK
jgi:hypothetical protein